MTADLSDLKEHIADYMERVREGETVFITDHEKVVAKLQRATEADTAAEEQAWIEDLIRRGIAAAPVEPLTPEENERLIAELLGSPPQADVVAAVLKEREGGW